MNRDLINEALTRSVDKIYPSREEVEKKLLSGKKLKIYLGVDPTGPHLHLGHATNLLVLRRFQELGHEIILLIGDFTARIGDPTDKSSTRQPLTEREVKENLKTFKKQASKVLRFSGKGAAKVEFNSKWWGKMRLADYMQIEMNFTVQQMLQRDMFQERIKENKPIGAVEFDYPILQGYDSVAMDIDMEIGGTDQTFNMLVGRDLMKIYKNKNKFVLTTKLLENPKTGKKLMNKSEGGLVNLDDEPNDMYGKVMALPDEAIIPVAEHATDINIAELDMLKKMLTEGGMNPRDAKARVAHWVVRTFYDEKKASVAEREFEKVFQTKELPSDIPVHHVGGKEIGIVDLLVETKLATSKSEARRLVEQGGVHLGDSTVSDVKAIASIPSDGIILRVGKRHFVKIIK